MLLDPDVTRTAIIFDDLDRGAAKCDIGRVIDTQDSILYGLVALKASDAEAPHGFEFLTSNGSIVGSEPIVRSVRPKVIRDCPSDSLSFTLGNFGVREREHMLLEPARHDFLRELYLLPAELE